MISFHTILFITILKLPRFRKNNLQAVNAAIANMILMHTKVAKPANEMKKKTHLV